MTSSSPQVGKEMSEEETHAFLESRDNGVLSLGADDRGYGFPISYTYEVENDRLILGFVSPPDSKKREFAETTDEATLTVYSYDDIDTWRSVIAVGTIRHIDEDTTTYNVPDLFFRKESETSDIANLDQFDRRWYEFEIETLSGYYSGWE